jgi:hypothetical protein
MQTTDRYEFAREYASTKDPNKIPDGHPRATNSSNPSPDKEFSLLLVRENQPEPEPDLWSLFVTRKRGEPGSVYRVRGNVVDMQHAHEDDVDALQAKLFKDAYTIALLTGEQTGVVRRLARMESPPCAPDLASARENCQGWTARLLKRLAEENVVASHQLEAIDAIVDPVR